MLVEIEDAFRIIRKAKPTIYTLVRKGLLPAYKKGKKLYFYEGELLAWIENGRRKLPNKHTKRRQLPGTAERFIPLEVTEPSVDPRPSEWTISSLVLSGPSGEVSISADTIASVVDLLERLLREGRS